ncbi:unnamed protein product [Staurois parvus]|uniref:Uncharacterized protein n=1 Tax=Staurois parvus TaxID=386267 RepID=A0ABN9CZN7_9NEOB|nr:unnamed protein product [Staurois parvus]
MAARTVAQERYTGGQSRVRRRSRADPRKSSEGKAGKCAVQRGQQVSLVSVGGIVPYH